MRGRRGKEGGKGTLKGEKEEGRRERDVRGRREKEGEKGM